VTPKLSRRGGWAALARESRCRGEGRRRGAGGGRARTQRMRCRFPLAEDMLRGRHNVGDTDRTGGIGHCCPCPASWSDLRGERPRVFRPCNEAHNQGPRTTSEASFECGPPKFIGGTETWTTRSRRCGISGDRRPERR